MVSAEKGDFDRTSDPLQNSAFRSSRIIQKGVEF